MSWEQEQQVRFYQNMVKDGIRALSHAGERLAIVAGALTLGVDDPDNATLEAAEVTSDLLTSVNAGQEELESLLYYYVRDLEVLRDWDA